MKLSSLSLACVAGQAQKSMDERIQEGSFTRLERSFKLEKRPAKTRRAGVSAERTMVRP